MIKIMNNKDKDFYLYLGKFFGSRIVQTKTKDRLYDDDNKTWYLYIENEKVQAVVSVCDGIIKNVYCTNEDLLVELLKKIKKDVNLVSSTVPICYEESYRKAGFKITRLGTYKNFVLIRSDV